MTKGMNYYRELNGEERREMPRFRVSGNCSFQVFDHTLYYDEFNIYKIENIGLGGLAFLSEKAYDINTRFYIIIAIQESPTQDPINAVGEVIWSAPCRSIPSQYRIGVRFTKMLQDDLMNLTHHFHTNDSSVDLEKGFHLN